MVITAARHWTEFARCSQNAIVAEVPHSGHSPNGRSGSTWDFPGFRGRLRSLIRRISKDLRAHTADVTVTAPRIVEGFYVRRDCIAGNGSILVDRLLDMFLLQATEERFCDGIVPTVSSTAHTRYEVISATEALPAITSVLRTLIRVYYGAPWADDGAAPSVGRRVRVSRHCRYSQRRPGYLGNRKLWSLSLPHRGLSPSPPSRTGRHEADAR